jgi:hypothetical protein
VKAPEVKDALRRRHGYSVGPDGRYSCSNGAWVCIEEAFSGFASPGGGIDLLAIGAWSTAKAPGLKGAGRRVRNPIVAYEVKVSRSDYRREVNGYQPSAQASHLTRVRGSVPPWPMKAYWALKRSNYFVFATPKGLLRDEEVERRERPEGGGLWLPPEAGLVEVDERGWCEVRVPAEASEAEPITMHEAAELIRHALHPMRERR